MFGVSSGSVSSIGTDTEIVQQHHARVEKILERQRKDGFLSYDEMSYFCYEISQLAGELKEREEACIKDLVTNGPRVFYENGYLNILLLRNGKPHRVGEGSLLIQFCSTDDDKIRSALQLDVAPDDDGQTYYINVGTLCQEPMAIGLTKTEWMLLAPQIPISLCYLDGEKI